MVSGVKITGIEQLKKNGKQLTQALNQVNKKVVIEEANNLIRVMKIKCPKDEHHIERAINKRIWKEQDGVIGVVVGVEGGHPEFNVGKGKYYPASQEYGWEYPKGVYHAPHPYIRPAFDENVGRIKKRLQNAYKQIIERVGR